MMKGRKWRVFILVLGMAFILVLAVNQFTRYRAKAALEEYSAAYSREGTPNATERSMPRIYLGVEKKPHGVLLLHGIPSSTSTFAGLCERLKDEKIPHLAPMLTGFGNTRLNLLPNVVFEDWLRDALIGYDTLAECVENVSIVSTSTGSLMATWLSERRPVTRLFLVAPNFSPGPVAARYKAILDTPVASNLLRGVMPYQFSSPEDYADPSRYRYPFQEVNSVREMFRLQDEINPGQIRVSDGLFLFSGSNDTQVSTSELQSLLERKASKEGVRFRAYNYEAGHGLLQGPVAEQLQSQIIEILKEHRSGVE